MTSRLRFVCLVILLMSAKSQLTSAIAADEAKQAEGPKVNASPTLVFNVYRKAIARQDWRTVFACLTPSLQEKAVFDAYVSCQTTDQQLAAELLAKHGVEPGSVDEEYAIKTRAEQARVAGTDFVLYRQIVSARIKDKAQFFESASKLINSVALMPVFGEARDVTVDGVVASAKASKTTFHLESVEPGNRVARRGLANVQTVRFRLVGKQWLIEEFKD